MDRSLEMGAQGKEFQVATPGAITSHPVEVLVEAGAEDGRWGGVGEEMVPERQKIVAVAGHEENCALAELVVPKASLQGVSDGVEETVALPGVGYPVPGERRPGGVRRGRG